MISLSSYVHAWRLKLSCWIAPKGKNRLKPITRNDYDLAFWEYWNEDREWPCKNACLASLESFNRKLWGPR